MGNKECSNCGRHFNCFGCGHGSVCTGQYWIPITKFDRRVATDVLSSISYDLSNIEKRVKKHRKLIEKLQEYIKREGVDNDKKL